MIRAHISVNGRPVAEVVVTYEFGYSYRWQRTILGEQPVEFDHIPAVESGVVHHNRDEGMAALLTRVFGAMT